MSLSIDKSYLVHCGGQKEYLLMGCSDSRTGNVYHESLGTRVPRTYHTLEDST